MRSVHTYLYTCLECVMPDPPSYRVWKRATERRVDVSRLDLHDSLLENADLMEERRTSNDTPPARHLPFLSPAGEAEDHHA